MAQPGNFELSARVSHWSAVGQVKICSLSLLLSHIQIWSLCMIAWKYICNKEGRKGAICFLACQHRGVTDMMTFKILPSISHCGTTSGGILEAGQLSLFWYKLLRYWPKHAICPFIYMSNMSNKQMAQSDTKHSNIGEKLLTTTFLFCFFGQNHQFEPFATLQISGLWHLNILPSWWNVILITSLLSQKSFCKTLFFYNIL